MREANSTVSWKKWKNWEFRERKKINWPRPNLTQNKLVHLETVAMNAVKGVFQDEKGNFTRFGEPDRPMARRLLYGKEYHLAKSGIMKSIDDFYMLLESRSGNELSLMQQKTKAVLTSVTILTAMTILFSVFAFLLLKHRIITPLYRLKSSATHLKEGNYDHHIDISSDDEAGDLARTFNAMADSIRERTTRLQSIIEIAIDGIIVTSQYGIIREFSPAAERIFGYEAGEVIGKNISLLMAEPDRSRHEGDMSHYLAAGKNKKMGKRFETRAVGKDGEIFSISISVSGARVGGGTAAYLYHTGYHRT